jgi:putative flippase GtrA
MALIKYLLVGVANTAIGLSVIYSAMYFLRLDVVPANLLGYGVGIVSSFILNKHWTFASNDHVVSSFLRFLLVLAVAYAANLGTVLVAVSHFDFNPYIAQALGVLPYTAIGFLGSRFFAFRSQRGKDTAREHAYETSVSPKKSISTRPIDVSIVVPCFNEALVLPETTIVACISSTMEAATGRGK